MFNRNNKLFQSWLAACSECFLTWGLLGAAAMQIASHTKQRRPGLARHTIVIALVTLIILLLAAFVANACATLLRAQGLHYVPSSFGKNIIIHKNVQ